MHTVIIIFWFYEIKGYFAAKYLQPKTKQYADTSVTVYTGVGGNSQGQSACQLGTVPQWRKSV
jgi:hypothetical protein